MTSFDDMLDVYATTCRMTRALQDEMDAVARCVDCPLIAGMVPSALAIECIIEALIRKAKST